MTRSAQVIARWEASWQSGPPDVDDRDYDEVEEDERAEARHEDLDTERRMERRMK